MAKALGFGVHGRHTIADRGTLCQRQSGSRTARRVSPGLGLVEQPANLAGFDDTKLRTAPVLALVEDFARSLGQPFDGDSTYGALRRVETIDGLICDSR